MLSRRLFSWLLGLLSALSSLPAAIATGPAGAYERIGPIYQTYRIAVTAWGPDQQKILPGLAALGGSHKAGGANLKEMLNYLDKQNYDDAFFKDEGVTDLDDPDPHKAARALFFNGEIGLFKLANVFAGEGKSLPSTLEKVRTVLVDGESCIATYFVVVLLTHVYAPCSQHRAAIQGEDWRHKDNDRKT